MPSINYTGRFYAKGSCTSKGCHAALGFPIKASRATTARRFADKMLLDLLPGWTTGTVRLTRDGLHIDAWLLTRPQKPPSPLASS